MKFKSLSELLKYFEEKEEPFNEDDVESYPPDQPHLSIFLKVA